MGVNPESFTVTTPGGARALRARCLWAGGDLLVLVDGGVSHLGAVAAAAPRPSLADPSRASASASVLCYPGHKEDELARGLSLKLSTALETRVVVAAGVHFDGLDPAGIDEVMQNASRLEKIILQAAGRESGMGGKKADS